MKVLEHQVSNFADETIHARLAHGAFLIYVFFMFFGTGKPFPDLTPGVRLDGDSNPVNQLLSLLYILSFLSLIGKREQVCIFIAREKYLTLFMGWALLSVIWSDYSVTSLKRWISLFGEIIVCLAALMHFRWSEMALRTFRVIVCIYIPLTILSVVFVPEAIQWEFPAWRGLADTKNNLGQVTLFSIIILLSIIPYNRNRPVNALHYLLLGCAFIAYIGARSTTAFLIGAVLMGIYGSLAIGKMLKLDNFVRFFAMYVLLGGALIGAMVVVLIPEVLSDLFGLFGKDMTFSGRIDLWTAVLSMTEGKLLNGWGIGGFWVGDKPHLVPLFEEFVWIPNQAHQGYIDILNQLGIVGLGLMCMMILSYFNGLGKLRKGQVWMWLFISVLILNVQESVFFRPRHIGNFMFLFAYIALNTDLLKERWVKHVEQEINDSLRSKPPKKEKSQSDSSG